MTRHLPAKVLSTRILRILHNTDGLGTYEQIYMAYRREYFASDIGRGLFPKKETIKRVVRQLVQDGAVYRKYIETARGEAVFSLNQYAGVENNCAYRFSF